ncbi:uncharacterized protein LOC113322018 [Papaver somniferum]|uniref:uncharacterized protein LOC113322018 n=1 Tax=Papaver somniferum TaxID=3469 RepID=UPI000E702EA4|nr:uncharacterized protein LOC113322018 [Papaver somniferum]
MGNCLITQVTESVEVMKTDGSILEYKAPLEVHQVLSEFAGHAISDIKCYLKYTKNKSNVSIKPRNKHRTRTSTNVARIKVVVTKRQLKEMLSKKGIDSSSFQEIISQNHNKETSKQDSYTVDDAQNCKGWRQWRPILDSIPE